MCPGLYALQDQDRFLTFAPFADEQLLWSPLVCVLFSQGERIGERIHTVRRLWRIILGKGSPVRVGNVASFPHSHPVSLFTLPGRPEDGNRIEQLL